MSLAAEVMASDARSSGDSADALLRTEYLTTNLIERDRELALIGEQLSRARDGVGSTMLVRGAAGVGKSTLLGAAERLALARGLRILRAEGHCVEREVPFATVRTLFTPLLSRDSRLRAALQLSVPEVSPRPANGPLSRDMGTALHNLVWWLSRKAAEQPVVVLVDDVHWIDEPSLRWLTYLVARARILSVAVLLALSDDAPASGTLEALCNHDRVTVRRLSALSRTGCSILAGRYDRRLTNDGEYVDACHHATGGNPFLAHEVIRATLVEGFSAAPTLSQRVPDAVTRRVQTRLAHLGSTCLALAEAAAVLGAAASAPAAAALAGLWQ